ncbi:MAG: hypothetical protein HRT90_05585, partial [Candidatus Margulisbacteria bacterium]|nr:hypothetical protein [Candidatus Margulisiibacteriota bacterium]
MNHYKAFNVVSKKIVSLCEMQENSPLTRKKRGEEDLNYKLGLIRLMAKDFESFLDFDAKCKEVLSEEDYNYTGRSNFIHYIYDHNDIDIPIYLYSVDSYFHIKYSYGYVRQPYRNIFIRAHITDECNKKKFRIALTTEDIEACLIVYIDTHDLSPSHSQERTYPKRLDVLLKTIPKEYYFEAVQILTYWGNLLIDRKMAFDLRAATDKKIKDSTRRKLKHPKLFKRITKEYVKK